MKILYSTLLAGLAAKKVVQAQFSCTLTGKDESSCVSSVGDDNEHCVWCSLAGFNVCVSEQQAETMEQNLPGTDCERYSGSDDDAKTDDAVATDDSVSPTDDSLPDDFWTCLQKKDSKTCLAADCTWCDSKAGFGLCMTGPTADSASESDFFKCQKPGFLELFAGPEDPSCVMAFAKHPTSKRCKEATDNEGKRCEYCKIAGVAHVCLTEEQADAIGASCDDNDEGGIMSLLRGTDSTLIKDPMDTACLMAFLQDQTEESCKAAVDSDGNPCEFCDYQGIDLCLNEEQAEIGEAFGMECEDRRIPLKVQEDDPYDPSCALAFLENPTPDACVQTVDEDGNACKYCTLQGALNLCLTEEQAEVGKSLGIDCEENAEIKMFFEEDDGLGDISDPSCLMAQLAEGGTMSKDDCDATMDQDGTPCEYCTLEGISTPLCLTDEQAEVAAQLGGECDAGYSAEAAGVDMEDDVALPPDFFDCLKEYDQDDCDHSGCTWCNTEVGMGFCMSGPAARALSECKFFTCDTRQTIEPHSPKLHKVILLKDDEDAVVGNNNMLQNLQAHFPLDPMCLAAGMGSDDARAVCNDTNDSEGKPCVWCNAAGVYGVCLSQDGADEAREFVQCDTVM